MSLDKTATVIQHLVEERNKPGFDLICKVFEVYPNVSKDWLLQGSGPMLTTASETPKQANPTEKPARTAAEIPAAPVVSAEVSSMEAPATPVTVPASVPAPAPVVFATAESTVPKPTTPAAEPAAPAAPVAAVPLPAAAPVVAAPAVAAAPAAPDAGAWQTALYTQQMAHQLAMAEMRNQHLQDQQRLMQQMMDLMQRKMA